MSDHRSSKKDHRTGATLPSRPYDTGPYYYTSNSINTNRQVGDVAVREVETEALRAHQRRQIGRFLKGPIPLDDIAAAARLPGAALAVFLAAHHRAALTRNVRVTLPRGLMEEFGISRDAKARALRHLASADLIQIEYRKGRPVVVTLCDRRCEFYEKSPSDHSGDCNE